MKTLRFTTPETQDPNPVRTNLLLALGQLLHSFRLNEAGSSAVTAYLLEISMDEKVDVLAGCLNRYTFLLTSPHALNAFRDGFNASWLTGPNKGMMDTKKARVALKFAWELALPHMDVFHPVVG
jgi:hypothetical protein